MSRVAIAPLLLFRNGELGPGGRFSYSVLRRLERHFLATFMAFAPKPGCPMCGIVITAAAHSSTQSPRSPTFADSPVQPEIVWRDENFTAYREKTHPVSSNCHIIIAFKYVFTGLFVPHTNQIPIAFTSHRYIHWCVSPVRRLTRCKASYLLSVVFE